MIKVTFPDGSQREYPAGTTSWDIAGSISPRLQQDVLAAGVNGQIWDLMRPLKEDTELKLYKWEDPEGKFAYWHSSAHLMAEALQEIYPEVKFGIGPPIENGFYYDIDLGEGVQIKDADLAAIEAKMLEAAARKEPIIRRDITKAEVTEFFRQKGDEYKLELIADLPDGSITTYTQGGFTDLCRGPHVPNTGYIKAVKLLSVA
ncbi:MAG: TGS domain-containing protein, partial [Porphyromonadaceae bacterium]|nr:TGS domain-containing protein [Porphyromonadaceae bacterium]